MYFIIIILLVCCYLFSFNNDNYYYRYYYYFDYLFNLFLQFMFQILSSDFISTFMQT